MIGKEGRSASPAAPTRAARARRSDADGSDGHPGLALPADASVREMSLRNVIVPVAPLTGHEFQTRKVRSRDLPWRGPKSMDGINNPEFASLRGATPDQIQENSKIR